MKTEALIRALALDAHRPVVPVNRLVNIALLGGAAAALLMFGLLLKPRPDFATAIFSPGFCLKVAVAGCLALAAASLLDVVARPTRRSRSLGWLMVGPVLLAAGVGFELAVSPGDSWQARVVGRNAPHCLALIPLLSAGPAFFLMLALRRAAPANPGLAGAVVGLAAGGLGAMLYAVTCPDDSPLFVATWYSIAISAVTGLCFLAGRRWLTW